MDSHSNNNNRCVHDHYSVVDIRNEDDHAHLLTPPISACVAVAAAAVVVVVIVVAVVAVAVVKSSSSHCRQHKA